MDEGVYVRKNQSFMPRVCSSYRIGPMLTLAGLKSRPAEVKEKKRYSSLVTVSLFSRSILFL